MEKPLRFLVDDTLRGVTKKLRMIGYDTVERGGVSWWAALERAKKDERIVITLHGSLRQPPDVTVWILEAEDTNRQVQEVLSNIPAGFAVPKPLSRCLVCNVLISEIPAEEARKQVPPMVAEQQSSFYQCPQCHRIYWPGSHYHKMIGWLQRWEIPEKLGLPENNNKEEKHT